MDEVNVDSGFQSWVQLVQHLHRRSCYLQLFSRSDIRGASRWRHVCAQAGMHLMTSARSRRCPNLDQSAGLSAVLVLHELPRLTQCMLMTNRRTAAIDAGA